SPSRIGTPRRYTVLVAICRLSEQGHGLPDRAGGRLEHRPLLGGQLDLDDLLKAVAPELARHAEEEAAKAELALEPRRTRQDPLLVLDDRFDHLDGRRGGRIVGASRLEQVHDL